MVNAEWQKLIQEKRAARDAGIPQEWRLPTSILSKVAEDSQISAFDLLDEAAVLTRLEREITEIASAQELVSKISSRELSSYDVCLAFCKRAAVAHQLTNSLTEIFFDKALRRARWLDEYQTREGKTIGPLHGLPITLKDMINVKGEFATMGFVSHLKHEPATENSVIVDILDAAGAVFYCKTNVPQTLFVSESYNNVFGLTLNPHRLCLSPGGSSSGEAAQIALRGSIMGIGSDIAGSVRVPALCVGAYGFKPTTNRIPWSKQAELIQKGWNGIFPTLGPLTHTPQDLNLFMKTVIQAQPWRHDHTAHSIPWQEVARKQKLTIGVWLEDPGFPVFPTQRRIMRDAVQKLRIAGHDNLAHKFLADAGEAPMPSLAHMNPADYLDEDFVADLDEALSVSAASLDYQEAWAQVWQNNKLDVVLSPACRGTAARHGEFGPLFYSIPWNLLDVNSCSPRTLPVVIHADSLMTVPRERYSLCIIDGAPAGLQVIGWRFQDEHVLMATEVIADALNR
ncbi:hypothetical protein NLU13_3738 [Sarocladium strictum]|uniref:amidase n=1 Tax=Sarocladium strictum TaxID=5046 RepID=A0AA39LA31_SARSR|nr:hypothetical protein NLU13_3738 [Sarocladium strictum]